MKPYRDWLWDRKITIRKARAVLKDPRNERFFYLAALLLSRKNTPKEVFKYYIKPLLFLQYWNAIKRQMRKDKWNDPRIDYWQAIYETLKARYEKEGKFIKKETAPSLPKKDEFYKIIADKIKTARKAKGLTQKALAKKLDISQQIISRIEKGKENISIATLKKITDAIDSQIYLEIS